MICSSEKRFFTSNLLGLGNWTPNNSATQTWGDVATSAIFALSRRPAAGRLSSGVSPFKHLMTAPDQYGRTALHYAASNGDAALVKSLLSNGSDPNAQDAEGWSPLHFAAQSRAVAVADALLADGADTHLKDSYGNTPLFRAVFCSNGDGTVISRLRAAGADVHAVNSRGISPVVLARTIGNYDVAQFFADVPAG